MNDLNPLPVAVPMARAPSLFGLSRTTLYRLGREGRIRLLKCGRTTFVDGASARAFLASLPEAQLGKGRAMSGADN